MTRIVELVKWNGCGTGRAEQLAQTLANGIGFNKVEAMHINDLFSLKNIPLKAVDDAEYYVYYNCHPSSGHRTILYINDEGSISYKVESSGFGLSAMWNEVIVFTVQDKWY
jgi:hypothetical protein